MNEEASLDPLRKEADRIEEDCIISAKSHLNSSVIWTRLHYGLGIPASVVAALSAAKVADGATWGVGLAAIAAGLMAIATFVNPSKKAAEHMAAGSQYLALSKAVRRFRNIDLPSSDMQWKEARDQVESFSLRRDELNEASAIPLGSAVKKARKGIEAGETQYRTDSEASR